MDVKKIEEALFKDETFLKCLPILQEKYWDKAVPSKKLEFFNIMQKCISSVDSYFPEKVIRARDIFDDFPEQNILVGENKIVIKDSLFVKGINPYSLLNLEAILSSILKILLAPLLCNFLCSSLM